MFVNFLLLVLPLSAFLLIALVLIEAVKHWLSQYEDEDM